MSGLRCSSNHFLCIMDKMLQKGSLKGYIKNVDDIMLYSKTLRVLVSNFQDLLEICRDNWITLQPIHWDYQHLKLVL